MTPGSTTIIITSTNRYIRGGDNYPRATRAILMTCLYYQEDSFSS